MPRPADTASIASSLTTFGGKSWTNYARALLASAILGAVATAFCQSKYWQVGAGLGLFSAAYLTHRILTLRSYRFYMDDLGVWFTRGYLPWANGRWGVKWRDLDVATFSPSFLSWLFHSYSVTVLHRFTKAHQIFITRMHNGRAAVAEINGMHQEHIRAGRLK